MNQETTILDDDFKYKMDGSCWKFVPPYSEGIWNLEPGENILKHSLLLLYVQLTLIFILTSIIHFLLRRFQLPRLVSETLAGFVLGPSVMGNFLPNVSNALFPPQSEKIFYSLTIFGYIFFMFLIGVKMDLSLITKLGKREWCISLSLMFNLLLVGMICQTISQILEPQEYLDDWIDLFTATTMLTSFPVVACFLMHLKIINSELGHFALSTALLCDLQSVILVNSYNYMDIITNASIRVGIKAMALSLSLIVFVTIVLRRLMFWIIRRTPEGKPVKSSYTIFIVCLVIVVAVVGETVGIQYFYGPFIFGLTVPTGPPLASTLVEKLDTIVTGLFLPLMATFCGLKANLRDLSKGLSYPLVFGMTIGLFFKLIAVYLPAVWFNTHSTDAAALSLILTVKGIVELGTFGTNFNKQVRNTGEFTVAVVLILILASIIPIIVRKLHDFSNTYPGYQQRNILHGASNDDLRILVCTHRQDDALAGIRLLEISHPTKESPLSVYGLYLEPLTGGSTPLLINHQLGQKYSKSGAHRQPIIHVFRYFKAEHPKFVQVQVFSAISPPKVMHEDICWLAFDKSISLIILPCHRKWNARGELISDSQVLRNLNSKVLHKAPSSVGILIDRSRIHGPSSIFVAPFVYRLAVLYMGGEDDMEALAYARRMARSSRVHLTVIHFTLSKESGYARWTNTIDDEFLNGLKKNDEILGNLDIIYKEEAVKDGSDTAMIIRSMEEKYDLVLVGRRHRSDSPFTLGLSEWCDLPELGPIGDLFASSDITASISILVIQQQIIRDEQNEALGDQSFKFSK